MVQGIDEIYLFAADMGGAGYIFTGAHDAAVMHNSAMINLNTLELGTALADAVDAAWPQLQASESFAPRVFSEQVTLERRTFTPEQIA